MPASNDPRALDKTAHLEQAPAPRNTGDAAKNHHGTQPVPRDNSDKECDSQVGAVDLRAEQWCPASLRHSSTWSRFRGSFPDVKGSEKH